MRLRHIEVFHAIKRTGSISRASELLSISQPAVSKVLKHAELRLGFKLFRRVRGRLEPSEEAEILFVEVEKVIRDLDGVRRVARNLLQQPGTPLRVGCLAGLGMSLVPMAAALFRQARPRAAIEIGIRRSADLAGALLTHELDLGLDIGAPDLVRNTAGLDATLLMQGEMVYIEPRSENSQGVETPIAIADIDIDRLIGLNPGDPMGSMVRDALETPGGQHLATIQVQTHYVAKALVALGGGCAIIDEFTARAGGSEGIHVRRITPPIRFGVQVVVPTFRPRPENIDAFIESLRMASERLGRQA